MGSNSKITSFLVVLLIHAFATQQDKAFYTYYVLFVLIGSYCCQPTLLLLSYMLCYFLVVELSALSEFMIIYTRKISFLSQTLGMK